MCVCVYQSVCVCVGEVLRAYPFQQDGSALRSLEGTLVLGERDCERAMCDKDHDAKHVVSRPQDVRLVNLNTVTLLTIC